jgi:hypothetical protein
MLGSLRLHDEIAGWKGGKHDDIASRKLARA